MVAARKLKSIWGNIGLIPRLLLSVALVMLVGTVVSVSVRIHNEAASFHQQQAEELQEAAAYLAPVLIEQLIIGDYATIKQLLTSQVNRRIDFYRISLRDSNGNLMVLNGPKQQQGAPAWFQKWVDMRVESRKVSLNAGGEHYGDLEIELSPAAAQNQLWKRFLGHVYISFTITLCLFLVIAFLVRVNLKTLTALSNATNTFRRGNRAVRVTASGAPELRSAADAFNNMANQIESLFSNIERSKSDVLDQLHFTQELIEVLPIPVFYKDLSGRYLGVNRAWEELFGVQENEVIGKTVLDIYAYDKGFAELHEEMDRELYRDRCSKVYEAKVRTSDNREYQVIYSKAPFTHSDGSLAGLIGVITDLTELKRAEEFARQALVEKLGAESASEAKTTFLANMSHEIRTPLTAIIGFSESLLDRNQSLQERLDSINTVIRSGKHLLNIINNILDLSKIEARKLVVECIRVELFPILGDVCSIIRLQAQEKGIDFRLEYVFPLPRIICTDPVRIKQILINLLNNSVKFTEKGMVTLRVSCPSPYEHVCFDVTDTGIGISDEQKQKLFNPFIQADAGTTRKYGGTGLGLFISRQLAEMLGGSIVLDSTAGEGSKFVVSIATGGIASEKMMYTVDEYADTEEVKEVPQKSLHGKILLVEDNGVNQKLITMHIRRLGVSVDAVENGKQACEQALKNDYDLILMDMQMPVMDGMEATRYLRQHGYHRPIVALTANVMKQDIERCLAAGCDDFLGKPIDVDNFTDVLTRFLKKDENVSAGQAEPIYSSILSDEPDLEDLVGSFIEKLPQMIQDIQEDYASGNHDGLKRKAHDLKAVGGGYGYPLITQIAAKLEFEVARENKVGVDALLKELRAVEQRILSGWEHRGSASVSI